MSENGRERVIAVVAAVVFGCATIAAIVLMTWIVATDSARKDERAWQHNQIQELLQRQAIGADAAAWQRQHIEVLEMRVNKNETNLAVALDRKDRKE